MPQLWESYGFRWGGNYSGSKDAMHYEFMGSVSDAASQTTKARNAGLGGSKPPTGSGDDEVTDDDVKKIANAVWDRMISQGDGSQLQQAWMWLVQAKNAAENAANK
jgi:hypothetical protein